MTNNSGEEYEDAQVRLVVGTDQPRGEDRRTCPRAPANVDQACDEAKAHFRGEVLRKAMEMPRRRCRRADGAAASAEKPKEVAKEGLGEYFIYTIEGTETIRNGWSKRMRSLEAAKVPVKIQYRYRPRGIWRPTGADVSS